MCILFWNKKILTLLASILICCTSFANEQLFREARSLQRDGKHDEAIAAFKHYLSQPADKDNLTDQQLNMHAEALVQLMNTFQSKGEPEACIITLQEVFAASPIVQEQGLRDFYSVLGYALSRTEKMKEAEETMLKVFTLPLHHATPERYFRDYAYAAAVFYSNPNYQKEVVYWCQEALAQAELCKNTSGKQWVTAMLGSYYKQNGQFNKAIALFQQSREEAMARKDDLGVLNSLHALVDLYLYWHIPEYANLYAGEAVRVAQGMDMANPMVTAQSYINKGQALLRLGELDSAAYYTEQARELCQALPYNSGMVDVDLLHGTLLTEKGGDALYEGIQELLNVTRQGTDRNRAKAYHQLAQTYLRCQKADMAELMLDSMTALTNRNGSATYIHVDYEPILLHYLKGKNAGKVEHYMQMMLQEQQTFKEKSLKYNLIESIVDLQTEQKKQELKVMQLKQANQRLWLFIYITIFVIIIAIVIAKLLYQKRLHALQMQQAEDKVTLLMEELSQSNLEKEKREQEIREFLNDKDKRQELETLTPSLLQTEGEVKFCQCFELLYPLFLPRLREKVPTITPREELLSMLIVLKQDNKRIAELLAIAPRSVLMLRHRFRQKIGMDTELSLENFIEEVLTSQATLAQRHDTTKHRIQEQP